MEWGVEVLRRLTLKLPTYGKSIANWVTNTLQTLFSESCVPPALKFWLRRTICVVPVAPRKIQGVVRKMRAPPCARWIPTFLGDLPQATVQVPHSGLGVTCLTRQLDAEQILLLQNTVQLHLQDQPCLCTTLMAMYPPLRNATGHLALRHQDQLNLLLPKQYAAFFTEYARTPTLPVPEDHQAMMRDLKRKILLAFVQVPTHVEAAPAPHSPGQNKACPLLSPQQVHRAIARIEDHCAQHTAKIGGTAPWLMPEFTATVRSMMRTMKLVGDTWDKRPHKLYACCDLLSESHTLLHIICGKKFVIWGWAENEIQAQQWVLLYILSSARDHNILHRAARHCAVKKLFLDPTRATDWVLSNVTLEATSLVIRVPTAYQKLKW